MVLPKLITPPAVLPVERDDVARYARLSTEAELQRLDGLLPSAVRAVEAWAGRRLITQTWDYAQDTFPRRDRLALPWVPLQDVTSVTYINSLGQSQVLDPATYVVDSYSEPGQIVLAPDCIWPVTQARRPLAVTVRYVLGYGDQPAAVPEPLRLLIQAVATHYYDRGVEAHVPWDSLGGLALGYGPALGIA